LSGWQVRRGHGTVPGMTTCPNPYRNFRFPAEVIEHAVWLCHCFSLSPRDVETILAACGVLVSRERKAAMWSDMAANRAMPSRPVRRR